MWETIFDWNELLAKGGDAATYFVMAAIGTLFFLLRLLFALFAGGDADIDTDVDGAAASEGSFTLFSLLSVLAFFMGAGWMGLACRIEWDLPRLPSALIAMGFGLAMMVVASAMTYGMRRLNAEAGYDVRTAIGRTGRVYLTIPKKGTGHGQVEVSVSGRKKILTARSEGPKIEAFSDVTIVEVIDDDTLIVKPKD